MSHAYQTSTFSVDPGAVPARFDSPDPIVSLRSAVCMQQSASPGELTCVLGSTRSGWAIYTLGTLLEAVELPSLRFLSAKGHRKFETEYGETWISVLTGPDLATVASDLRTLISRVRADPMLALDADTAGAFIDLERVAAALARDYVCPKPAYDHPNVRGDEGEGADYFFTWLRSILRVVEGANAQGRALVHLLDI